MAADRAAPWSRWDGFQVSVISSESSTIFHFSSPNCLQTFGSCNGTVFILLSSVYPATYSLFLQGNVTVTENPYLAGPGPFYDVSGTGGQQQLITQFVPTGLVGQRVNTIDPSYYDCIYSTINSLQNVTQLCYKDLGCCSTGCCKDTDWNTKYGWAVALIVIFCILVIVAVVITLVIWLFNRSKDKKQKRQLLHGSGLSPATSQMSLARPIQGGYHFGTGPYQNPPDGGYRY